MLQKSDKKMAQFKFSAILCPHTLSTITQPAAFDCLLLCLPWTVSPWRHKHTFTDILYGCHPLWAITPSYIQCLITAGLKCATRGIEQHRALLDHLVLWLKTPRCTAVQDPKNFKLFKALLKMFSLMEILEHLFLDELLRLDQTFLWFA